MPWNDKVLGIFNKKKVDNYQLYIGTLPKQPGTIVLTHTVQNPRHTEKQFVSQQFYQTSAVDGGNNDHNDVPYLVTPDVNWNVKRNTSAFNTAWQTGVWGQSFISDDANRVHYNVTTIHKTWGTSGQVRFTISFTEYLDDTFPTSTDENVALNWGDSKIIPYPNDTWKVTFTGFDGSVSEYSGEEMSNPFLKIGTSGMGYTISTANPATLNWPQ